MRIIDLKKNFEDKRGKIEEIFKGKPFREINRFTSEKDTVRGNHYHKETEEIIFIAEGKVHITIKNMKSGQTFKVTLKKDQGILIEPYELHTVSILEKTVWYSFLTKEYDPKKPDVFKEK